jgi:hypothetical protein
VSAALFIGLLLGFFVGVGAALTWAACSTATGQQTRPGGPLPPEAEAVVHRLAEGAELVRALMLDILRGSK